jgi:hypothetical protein
VKTLYSDYKSLDDANCKPLCELGFSC